MDTVGVTTNKSGSVRSNLSLARVYLRHSDPLATKQIGQRFRLAEDYGFKASVAKEISPVESAGTAVRLQIVKDFKKVVR